MTTTTTMMMMMMIMIRLRACAGYAPRKPMVRLKSSHYLKLSYSLILYLP